MDKNDFIWALEQKIFDLRTLIQAAQELPDDLCGVQQCDLDFAFTGLDIEFDKVRDTIEEVKHMLEPSLEDIVESCA